MPLAPRSCCLAAAIAGAACTSPPPPAQQDPVPPGYARPRDDSGHYGQRWLVEGFLLPSAWLERDVDSPSRTAPDSVRFTGSGYGLRAATGNRDQSVGFCYQGFDVDSDDDHLGIHALGLDVDVRTLLQNDLPGFYLRAGAGLGGAFLDESGGWSGTEAMAQLRLGLQFQPHESFALDGSIGGIVFGHPGETEVYGTFLTVGATFVF